MSVSIRTVDVGGIDLEIAETGAGGRPLLLVHGFTGSKEDFVDHWDRLAERGWHVVAVDLRGHGGSGHPTRAEDYSLELFEADIMGLLGHLGWDHLVLLGHSMGGMVSQSIAIHHPDLLDGLVLMDTIGGPVAVKGPQLMMITLAGRILGLRTMARFARKAPPKSPEAVRRLYVERPDYGPSVEAKILASSQVMARSMMTQLGKVPDRIPELRSLRIPTLVIVGEHDMPGFLEGSRAMAAAIPDATLVVIDGAGHSPQFEVPDAWTNAVDEFLDALPDSPADEMITAVHDTEGDH